MHTIHPNSFFFILFISILFFSTSFSVLGIKNNVDLVQFDQKPIKEKLNHFRLYWHDIVSGRAPTSIEVVKSHNNNGFGSINMIDNPLTLEPELSSKVVGKAQGFYALASQEEFGVLMVMNFAFTYGKYNGSTITILGRNEVLDHVREMPVIGGTGFFRFARGYVKARTHYVDLKTRNAVVEYNVYVLNY